MMRLRTVSSLSFLFVSLVLSGCSGNSTFPDASANPAVTSPPLTGGVFGGHAPVVGAQVYILTPSKTAYAGPGIAASASNLALSLMDGDAQNTGTTSTGTGNGLVHTGGLNGYHYITTDSTGYFNLTGDYACSVDQPVYIVAVSGSATYPSFTNSFGVNNIVVTNVSGTGTNATATYQFTLSQPPQEFYTGETITFSGFTDAASGQNFAAALVSGTAGTIVNIASQTPNTFTVTAPDPNGEVGAGTYSTLGTATGNPVPNPAIINMAGLGLCPSTGNFSTTTTNTFAGSDNGAIPFIVMNEVSTTALAYALAGFGTDAFHIGVIDSNTYGQSYAKNGLKQALYNAFNIYDIAGVNNSTSNPSPGEGHIARSTTPGGNGTIPTSLVDTIGNILAACVDSANTSASASPNCQQLFLNATSTGKVCTAGSPVTCPTGTTAPADIATAAFNMAHFPAGLGNSTFVSSLFAIPQGEVPFAPNLAAAPNDFSIGITFTAPASATSGGSLFNQPQSVTIDAGNYTGNESAGGGPQEGVWVGNFGGQTVKLFTLTGVPDYTTNSTLGGLAANFATTNTRQISVDTANNIWMPEQGNERFQKFTATGGIGLIAITGYNLLSGTAFNNSGYVFTADAGTGTLYRINSNTGGIIQYESDACSAGGFATAFDNNNTYYILSSSNKTMCAISNTGSESAPVSGFQNEGGGYQGPAWFAVGRGNIVWAPSTTLNTVSGATATLRNNGNIATFGITSTLTGGGLNNPCSIAVDGAGTIWVGNAGNSSISAFNVSGTAVSPAKTSTANSGGYFPINQASNCANPAIDRAGNIWIAYQGFSNAPTNVVYELVGAAAPTITPLAAAVTNGTIGTLP